MDSRMDTIGQKEGIGSNIVFGKEPYLSIWKPQPTAKCSDILIVKIPDGWKTYESLEGEPF